MTDRELAAVEMLARIGIAIAPNPRAGGGWGWSIQNDKIVRDWDGPHATPACAAGAALEWLLEYARKGLLCHHTHPTPIDDDPLAPWLRAFEAGIALPE
jgi:hypothetical protein